MTIQRRLRLTPDLVDRVQAGAGGGLECVLPPDRHFATEEEHAASAARIREMAAPFGDVWVFAYGSLIWNPDFDFVERRTGLLRGWHRSFCLGWDRWFRGCVDRPGLMLAIDRGGQCQGVAFRLPPDAIEENIDRLVRREMRLLPHPFPPRMVRVVTDEGPIQAVTFAMDRKSPAYVGRRPVEEIADVLAAAVGQKGSMAEYLHNTVLHLEELGIHDRRLWQLQEMVAERIEAAHASERA